jgi:hypothetical protein
LLGVVLVSCDDVADTAGVEVAGADNDGLVLCVGALVFVVLLAVAGDDVVAPRVRTVEPAALDVEVLPFALNSAARFSTSPETSLPPELRAGVDALADEADDVGGEAVALVAVAELVALVDDALEDDDVVDERDCSEPPLLANESSGTPN